MNQDNRVVIEKGLDASKPLSTIAAELGKDPTTIAKEIKKHRAFQEHNKYNNPTHRCALTKNCHRKNVCSNELFCKRECKRCNRCHNFCPDYILLITVVQRHKRHHTYAMAAQKEVVVA